ncbi:hypothetical protein FUAX_26270 [Fulvitalea axinellae]|uniref:Alpha/beta hydrolase n=1 Tax=Fulvitalea axinellae TaxID=1182444 RepID=A0AAU9DGM7_9BACT|nr:hypothetical protein FUAX_26270 [Fulvitalea axinellae]
MYVNGTIQERPFQLAYEAYGKGPSTLITFHGYGQFPEVFRNFEKIYPDTRVLSVWLFHHGTSKTPLAPPVSENEWIEMFQKLLSQEKVGQFSLLAFSIGCRLAFSILHKIPERIEKATFLAPDGILKSFTYSLACRTSVGKLLFKSLTGDSDILPRLIQAISKTGALPRTLTRFALSQITTSAQRKKLYRTWISLSRIFLSKKALESALAHPGVGIILASRDNVIPESKIRARIPSNVTVRTLPCGHTNLIQTYEKEVKQNVRR